MDPDPSSFILFAAAFQLDSSIFYLIFFILLLICSALISGAEVAFFSLTPTELEDENVPFHRRSTVAGLLERPKKLLATILIANNAINITSVLIFGILSNVWFAGLEPIQIDLGFVFELDIRFILEIRANAPYLALHNLLQDKSSQS